jgi:hypothetical protein
LTALVTPAGDMTLSALLWTTIGSAPAYQIATGCIEVLAAVLLLLPRTVTLGALLALASLSQVLLLNLTFDIGVKLVTMHLIVLAAILLIPMVRLKPPAFAQSASARPRRSLGGGGDTTLEVRLNADTTWTILPIVLGAYLLGMQTWSNWSFWHVAGGGRPQSALYGIWNVEQLSVDGVARPPEANDYDRRWRRVIFDEPEVVVFQRTDDSFARYGASIDRASGTVALTKGDSRTWAARFTYDRTSDNRLTIAGDMDGHRIEADLRRVEREAFPLLNSSFRWIRPHDP